MGLSGRKTKQRIGADPRNLTWADDAAKFGQSYLQKLGWDPSKGLGVSGEGRTSHIKVRQKLNLLGIGAGASGTDGADPLVAWKQNREYEELLRRLNSGADVEEERKRADEDGGGKKEEVKEKKRKKGDDHGQESVDDEKTREKKKRKKDKKEKREKKKKRKDESADEKLEGDEEDGKATSKPVPESEISSSATPAPAPVIQAPTPRPMAHRARFLRSKQLASRSSTAVAEILGISASNSTSSTPVPSSSSLGTPLPPNSTTPSLNPTPGFSPPPAPEKDQELRTASTSVHDYFKEKLAARALARSGRSTGTSSPLNSESTSAPDRSSIPAGSSSASSTDVAQDVSRSTFNRDRNRDNAWVERNEDESDASRAGLGSTSTTKFTEENGEDYAPRAGLGLGMKSQSQSKFGSLMGGFTSASRVENNAGLNLSVSGGAPAATTTGNGVRDADGDEKEPQSLNDGQGGGGSKRKKEKKKRKEEKRKDCLENDGEDEEEDPKPTGEAPIRATGAEEPVVGDSEAKRRREKNEKREKRKRNKKEKRESDSQ